jgi:hypothetical protein
VSSPVSYADTDDQSYSTTTRQSGDPGTIENPLSGVSHAVTLPVSLAFLLFIPLANRQSPDPTVQVKQVSLPTRLFPPTPYWKHAKSTTGSKKPPRPNEQLPKPKNLDLGNVKKLSDGLNRKKEKRLNLIKPDSKRLLKRRKRERTFLKQNSWRGQRNQSRMFLRRRWVSYQPQYIDFQLTITEAYRMSKQAYDDPMANYKDEEDL